jgi:U3 small nucleolar RNA-associated protein 18
MNMRRVVHRFTDEGCLQGTTLAVASSNQFLAAGSAQGVVNLYDVEDVLRNKLPKPRKTIMNLTTSITDLKFNSTSEILALTSAEIKNSIKLFHLASGTVFSNFPPFQSKMGHINVVNFSPNSGYFAFGNRKSTVALYTLKHYKNY